MVTVGDTIDRWLMGRVARREIAPATAKYYGLALRDFASFVGPDRDICTLAEDDFAAWLGTLTRRDGRAYKTSSANTFSAPVRAFLKWANARGMIPTNPAREIRPAKEPKRLPRNLPDETVEQLLAVGNRRDRTMVLVLALLGLRRAELARMRVQDWDQAARQLRVIGKGDKERPLPVVGQVEEALADWVDYLDYRVGPMWPSPHDPADSIGPDTVSKIFVRLSKRIGREVTPHQLRHTCATGWVRAGVPLNVVQQLLGHEDISTTQRYLHAADEDLAAAVASRHYHGRAGPPKTRRGPTRRQGLDTTNQRPAL